MNIYKSIKAIAVLTICSVLLASNGVSAETNTNQSVTIKDYNSHSYIKSDGSLWMWLKNNAVVPTEIVGINKVKEVFESDWVVKQDGSVWFIDLSDRNKVAKFIEVKEANGLISANQDYGIDKDGKLFIVDYMNNEKPVVKLVDAIKDVVDVSLVYDTSKYFIVKSDGTLWSSDYDFSNVTQVTGVKDIKEVEAFVALDKNGVVWELYVPEHSKADQQPYKTRKLNISADIKALQPSVGEKYLAIDKQDKLWFWGYTRTGFSDGTELHEAKPVQFNHINKVTKAVAFERTIAVLTEEGKLFTTSTDVPSISENAKFEELASDVISLELGSRHIIFQKSDGKLWGYGMNKDSQLGYGTFEYSYPEPVPVQKGIAVSLNGSHIGLSNGVILRDNQTYVPLRSIFEAMGATITWDAMSKSVTITSNTDASLVVLVNYKNGTIYKNDSLVDQKTIGIIKETSYLPLRFISEQLGAKVDWYPEQEHVAITTY